jgi:nucleoside-diphosphate kinase
VTFADPKSEVTLLMVKPDGVRRGLVGNIISRIERVGLKVVALKMLDAPRKQMDGFYPNDEKWIARLGEKTLATYDKYGYDPVQELGTNKPLEIGHMVRGWLLDFMISAPVVLTVLKGVHAVEIVKKLVGDTMPANAESGTIRGDLSIDSAAAANRDKRAVFNLVHRSETLEEAEKEVSHWFSRDELADYRRSDDEVMFPD